MQNLGKEIWIFIFFNWKLLEVFQVILFYFSSEGMAWSDRSWEVCLWRCCHCHLLAGKELFCLIITESWDGLGWKWAWRPPGHNPLPWAGTPPPGPGYSEPHPTWPRDGASTASLGNLFQCLTTHTVKNFFQLPNLNLPYFKAVISCPITTLPDKEFLPIFPVGPFKYWRAL